MTGALAREASQGWSNDTELLAAIADRLGVLAAERRYDEVPPRIKRPWDPDEEPQLGEKVSSHGEVVKFFDATTKRKGA